MKRAKKARRLMGQMNVVPYIDVMLVLLIIFMVTAPLLQQGIAVALPQVDAEALPPDPQNNEPFILSVDAEGNFYINLGEDPESPVEDAAVTTVAAAILRVNANTDIYVKADARALHGRVAQGFVLLQKAGAEEIGILTDPVAVEAR